MSIRRQGETEGSSCDRKGISGIGTLLGGLNHEEGEEQTMGLGLQEEWPCWRREPVVGALI